MRSAGTLVVADFGMQACFLDCLRRAITKARTLTTAVAQLWQNKPEFVSANGSE